MGNCTSIRFWQEIESTALLVADSGERKTPVENKLFASIREFELAQIDLYKEQLVEWEMDDSIVQQKQKGIKDTIRKLASKGSACIRSLRR